MLERLDTLVLAARKKQRIVKDKLEEHLHTDLSDLSHLTGITRLSRLYLIKALCPQDIFCLENHRVHLVR